MNGRAPADVLPDAPGGPDSAALRPPPPGGRSRFDELAPIAIYLGITLCIMVDFAADIARGESALHLTGMAVGTVLSIVGLTMLLKLLRTSHARAEELATALDHTRGDSVRWKEHAGQMLKGIGALIDQQFAEWGLSPSEREVGLLLLKGLSLRDVASARGASEPTVRQQAQALYRKAKLAGRAELSAFFLEDLLLPQSGADARNTPPPVAPKTTRG